MKEIWKDIPEYEGHYQISNYGRIKTLNKIIYSFHGQTKYTSNRKEKILKPLKHRQGYYFIYLFKNKKKQRFYIARLVLTVFSRRPKKGEEACHYPDKNVTNNNIKNLQWATHKKNMSHRKIQGSQKVGEEHHCAKLKNIEVKEIFFSNKSRKELMKIYNVSDRTIFDIKNKKARTDITLTLTKE